MTVDERIKKCFNTEWNFTDFFYPYCEAKGYEDIESNEDITEEEYTELEKELESKLTYSFLRRLQDVVIEEINEIIQIAMEELAEG